MLNFQAIFSFIFSFFKTFNPTSHHVIQTTAKEYNGDLGLMRQTLQEFERVDILGPENFGMSPESLQFQALHGTLSGDGMIEAYEVYQKKGQNELSVLIQFGERLNGHPGIVHGGITSLALDNSFGWMFMLSKIPPAFTANLNINFR